MKKTLLIIFTVFGLYACSDELTEELKQTNSAKASAEEIQYEILSFEEFFYRLTETKQADQKTLQSIQNSYEIAKKRNQGSIEKDAVTDIVIDHFYDPIHTIETYSFVTQKFNEKGNFLEKFVVTINNEVLKTAYLRYYPEGGIFEELFTGKVELSTADQTITISDYFRNGERDNRTTNAVQKDCTTIFTFRSTRCTNGGRHKFGQMCGGKYTNDAYIYVTTDVVCKTTITSDIVQLSLELIDLNPAKGGGGGSSSNAKFENFLYSLPVLTKNMLSQNSDLKTAVSVYLMQKNYSAASIKRAADLLNYIANDTVLRTNNNKLTQQIVQLSLFTNKFTVNSFITFWSSLTTEEKMILQNYADNGLSANGNFLKPSVKSFLNWAIAYLIQNTDVTIFQFENWFMKKSEGQDFFYNASYWENPNLTFASQNLPTWAAFSSAYPNETSAQLYMVVGGDVAKARIKYPAETENGCALKVSRALNYSGIVIPKITNAGNDFGTVEGADGKYYFLNAKSLIIWMQKTFGTTTNQKYLYKHLDDYEGDVNNYGNGFKNSISGKKGIFTMFPINPPTPEDSGFDATGHADIFDGIQCKGACYFQDALEIHFWELN